MGVRFMPASTEFGSLEPILNSWAEWYMPVTLALDGVEIGGSLKLIDASQPSHLMSFRFREIPSLNRKGWYVIERSDINLRPLHATHSPHPFQEKANVLLEIGYLDEQHNLDSYTQVHGVCYRQDLHCDSDLSRTYWLSVTFLKLPDLNKINPSLNLDHRKPV